MEQDQAHQQAHHRLQSLPQALGLDPAQAGLAGKQARQEQQHHPRQAAQPCQQLGQGAHGERKAPDQLQSDPAHGLEASSHQRGFMK